MKQKHIDAAREARLWLGQIIVPAILGAVYLKANTNVFEWAGAKVQHAKTAVKEKFTR